MNLIELKKAVNIAIEMVHEDGRNPKDILVSIQVDINRSSPWSDDVRLVYDNDLNASGCVIVGDCKGS